MCIVAFYHFFQGGLVHCGAWCCILISRPGVHKIDGVFQLRHECRFGADVRQSDRLPSCYNVQSK